MLTDLELARRAYAAYVCEMTKYILPGRGPALFATLDELPRGSHAAWLQAVREVRLRMTDGLSLVASQPGPGEDDDLPADGRRGPVTLGRQAYEAYCTTVSATEPRQAAEHPMPVTFYPWTALPPSQRLAWCDAAAKVSRISERLSADRRPRAVRHACGSVCAEPGEDICLGAEVTVEMARVRQAQLVQLAGHVCAANECPDPDVHAGDDRYRLRVPDEEKRQEVTSILDEAAVLSGQSADGNAQRLGLRAVALAILDLTDTIGETLT